MPNFRNSARAVVWEIDWFSRQCDSKPLKLYVAFRRLKNFVCMSLISKQGPHVFLTLKLDPSSVELEKSFTRDVSNIGHWGTGDLEVVLRRPADFEKAKSLIERAYQEN